MVNGALDGRQVYLHYHLSGQMLYQESTIEHDFDLRTIVPLGEYHLIYI